MHMRSLFGPLIAIAAAGIFVTMPAVAAPTLDTGQVYDTPAVTMDLFDVVAVPLDGDMHMVRVLAFEVTADPCGAMATSADFSEERIPWVIDTFLFNSSDMCSAPLERLPLPGLLDPVPK